MAESTDIDMGVLMAAIQSLQYEIKALKDERSSVPTPLPQSLVGVNTQHSLSTFSGRVLIVLEEKGIEYESVLIR